MAALLLGNTHHDFSYSLDMIFFLEVRPLFFDGSCKGVCGGLALANSQTPTRPLTPLAAPHGEKKGRTGMRRLVGGDEDQEITYQLALWADQTWFGEN